MIVTEITFDTDAHWIPTNAIRTQYRKVGEVGMIDKRQVMYDIERCVSHVPDACRDCSHYTGTVGFGCMENLMSDAHALLKEQEARELTMDEWREWKNNSKRNPICELWEHDTSPMWILNPNDVHEPALLMGKLKLFTGKPTFKQCKEVKWE